MDKWDKESQEKISETVNKIHSYIYEFVKEDKLYNYNNVIETIYNYIDDFAEWLHNKTCKAMIDID